MTPRERLKQRAKEWKRKGCSTDQALSNALEEFDNLIIESNELMNIRHEIELEMEE